MVRWQRTQNRPVLEMKRQVTEPTKIHFILQVQRRFQFPQR